MKVLSYKEVRHIHGGGQYNDWQVVLISSAASGIGFAAIRAHATGSFAAAAPYLMTCSIPTALISALILGGLNLGHWALGRSSNQAETMA